MSESPEGSNNLFSEIRLALARGAGTPLESLVGLRAALHSFGHSSARHGLSLEDAMLKVHRTLMVAEDEVLSSASATDPRDPALARQVRAWCAEGYQKRPVRLGV